MQSQMGILEQRMGRADHFSMIARRGLSNKIMKGWSRCIFLCACSLHGIVLGCAHVRTMFSALCNNLNTVNMESLYWSYVYMLCQGSAKKNTHIYAVYERTH